MVPPVRALRDPVEALIVATDGFELDHVPPGDVAVQLYILPAHTSVEPEMVKGA